MFIPSRSKVVWVASFDKATSEQSFFHAVKKLSLKHSCSNAALLVAEMWDSARELLIKHAKISNQK